MGSRFSRSHGSVENSALSSFEEETGTSILVPEHQKCNYRSSWSGVCVEDRSIAHRVNLFSEQSVRHVRDLIWLRRSTTHHTRSVCGYITYHTTQQTNRYHHHHHHHPPTHTHAHTKSSVLAQLVLHLSIFFNLGVRRLLRYLLLLELLPDIRDLTCNQTVRCRLRLLTIL